MKKITAFLTALALTLSFGIAFADDFPTWADNKELTTTIFNELSPEYKTGEGSTGAAPGGAREEKADNGTTEMEKHQNYWNADRGTD
jgi:hypothetical protein